MKKYPGDAQLRGNLDVLSDKPLDSRLIVQNKSDLYSIDPRYAYVGMPVVCIADSAIYMLIDKTYLNFPEGWTRISGGKKQVVMEEDEYNELESYESDTLYFIYEPREEQPSSSDWEFGDDFPIILS